MFLHKVYIRVVQRLSVVTVSLTNYHISNYDTLDKQQQCFIFSFIIMVQTMWFRQYITIHYRHMYCAKLSGNPSPTALHNKIVRQFQIDLRRPVVNSWICKRGAMEYKRVYTGGFSVDAEMLLLFPAD